MPGKISEYTNNDNIKNEDLLDYSRELEAGSDTWESNSITFEQLKNKLNIPEPGGDVTDAENIPSGDDVVGIFIQKSGTVLQFSALTSSDNTVKIEKTDEDVIDLKVSTIDPPEQKKPLGEADQNLDDDRIIDGGDAGKTLKIQNLGQYDLKILADTDEKSEIEQTIESYICKIEKALRKSDFSIFKDSIVSTTTNDDIFEKTELKQENGFHISTNDVEKNKKQLFRVYGKNGQNAWSIYGAGNNDLQFYGDSDNIEVLSKQQQVEVWGIYANDRTIKLPQQKTASDTFNNTLKTIGAFWLQSVEEGHLGGNEINYISKLSEGRVVKRRLQSYGQKGYHLLSIDNATGKYQADCNISYNFYIKPTQQGVIQLDEIKNIEDGDFLNFILDARSISGKFGAILPSSSYIVNGTTASDLENDLPVGQLHTLTCTYQQNIGYLWQFGKNYIAG